MFDWLDGGDFSGNQLLPPSLHRDIGTKFDRRNNIVGNFYVGLCNDSRCDFAKVSRCTNFGLPNFGNDAARAALLSNISRLRSKRAETTVDRKIRREKQEQ